MKSRKKGLHLAKKKALFNQNNAPPHTPIVAMVKIKELKFDLLPHPPYLLYLVLSGFYLFANLKKWITVKIFTNDNQVSDAINGYFKCLDKSAHQSGITTLDHYWEKCCFLIQAWNFSPYPCNSFLLTYMLHIKYIKIFCIYRPTSVSYTHLDVYKRQVTAWREQ